MIWYFHTLWNDHHGKSSKCVTMKSYCNLIWPYSLFCISHFCTYLLYNWKFVPFNPLHLFHPHPIPFWQPFFVPCLWVCFCCFSCLVFLILYISEIIWYLSEISLSIIPFKSIHSFTNGKFSFFWWLSNILLCIYTTSSLSIHL